LKASAFLALEINATKTEMHTHEKQMITQKVDDETNSSIQEEE